MDSPLHSNTTVFIEYFIWIYLPISQVLNTTTKSCSAASVSYGFSQPGTSSDTLKMLTI